MSNWFTLDRVLLFFKMLLPLRKRRSCLQLYIKLPIYEFYANLRRTRVRSCGFQKIFGSLLVMCVLVIWMKGETQKGKIAGNSKFSISASPGNQNLNILASKMPQPKTPPYFFRLLWLSWNRTYQFRTWSLSGECWWLGHFEFVLWSVTRPSVQK